MRFVIDARHNVSRLTTFLGGNEVTSFKA